MSTATEMLDQVRATGLIEPGEPLVVMLSGGRDSTCLLDLMVQMIDPANVDALHVNYGLRPSADRDQLHCRDLCERLGVTLHVHKPAGEPAGNVQAWARGERFEAAARLFQQTLVATGHTATDQVETILYRLISSPSRRALIGMQPRQGNVIRPLLQFTREQTGDYCVERGLGWVDDETNATGKYVRNRIRHELLPLLNDLHPGAEHNILELARTLQDEQSVLTSLVNAELRAGNAAVGDTTQTIALKRLRELPPGLARLVVQRMADAVTDQPAPGAARRLPDILRLNDSGTAHLDLPHRVRVTATDGVLRFVATDAKPRDRAADSDNAADVPPPGQTPKPYTPGP